MCCEKHCIHERIVISLFMLTVFEKAPKIKCLPTKSTQKFSNLMIFILVKLYKSPKLYPSPKNLLFGMWHSVVWKKTTCHILFPFVDLIQVRPNIGNVVALVITVPMEACTWSEGASSVSLSAWGDEFLRCLGTHSSVVVMYMEKVFWFSKMYLFTISVNNTSFNCSSTCIVKFLTWKIKWIIKKIQCSFVNN